MSAHTCQHVVAALHWSWLVRPYLPASGSSGALELACPPIFSSLAMRQVSVFAPAEPESLWQLRQVPWALAHGARALLAQFCTLSLAAALLPVGWPSERTEVVGCSSSSSYGSNSSNSSSSSNRSSSSSSSSSRHDKVCV